MKNNLPLMPKDLTKSLNYSPTSIVSKIIFQDKNLQITFFAVAKDQSFDKHTTTKKALIHIIEGSGEFYLKNKWHNLV